MDHDLAAPGLKCKRGRPCRPVPSAYRSAPRSRGNPFLPAYAGQKFFPPGIPLGTKFGAEPRTRRKAARTLSAPNFPVCVPSIRTCRLDGTFLPVSDQVLAEEGLHLVKMVKKPRRAISWA